MLTTPRYPSGTRSSQHVLDYDEVEELGLDIARPLMTEHFETEYVTDSGGHYLTVTAKRKFLPDREFFFGEEDLDDWTGIERSLGR